MRARSIVLHNTAGKEMEIDFKDTARLGFEWCFEWEGEKYRWYVCVVFINTLYGTHTKLQCRVRESRITSVLECRCVRKTGKLIPDHRSSSFWDLCFLADSEYECIRQCVCGTISSLQWQERILWSVFSRWIQLGVFGQSTRSKDYSMHDAPYHVGQI